MRGQQSGYGIERVDIEPANLHVLALLSCYIALVLTSVFIMDWFVLDYSMGYHRSIDLWAVSTCDTSIGCVSSPLERAGFGQFRPFAVITLWLTALSAGALFVRTGAFLLGLRVSRRVSVIASLLLGASALVVLAMLFAMPLPVADGGSVRASPAPFLLVAAHVIGLLSIGLALRAPRAKGQVSDRGFPNARLVRDSR